MVERNYLGNYGRGSPKEHSCDTFFYNSFTALGGDFFF